MLVVEDLVVAYGGIQALKGVSLRVERGEYVGVIGPNGAGKTTLLLALSGALAIQSGRIALDGEDLAGVPQHRRVSRGIAIVPAPVHASPTASYSSAVASVFPVKRLSMPPVTRTLPSVSSVAVW